MKCSTLHPLYAVVGPQRLRAVIDLDGLEGAPARVGAGERVVPWRVPVLRQDDMWKVPRELEGITDSADACTA